MNHVPPNSASTSVPAIVRVQVRPPIGRGPDHGHAPIRGRSDSQGGATRPGDASADSAIKHPPLARSIPRRLLPRPSGRGTVGIGGCRYRLAPRRCDRHQDGGWDEEQPHRQHAEDAAEPQQHRRDDPRSTTNGMPFLARLFTRARVVVLVHHVHREQWSILAPQALARFELVHGVEGRGPRQPEERRTSPSARSRGASWWRSVCAPAT